MTILLFEDDLMWTSRLSLAAKSAGHKPVVVRSLESIPDGDVAIVNFHLRAYSPRDAVAAMQAAGIKTIGHAGHKEKSLLVEGREMGVDLVATNGELAHKLAGLLAELILSAERIQPAESQRD